MKLRSRFSEWALLRRRRPTKFGVACATCMLLAPSATVFGAACTVSGATLAFGNYNPVSGSITAANASIVVTCSAFISVTTTAAYTMLLSAGYSGNTNNRMLSGTTTPLRYNIYTTGAYSTVWDNVTGQSGSVTMIGLLGLPLLTYGYDTQIAYGQIFASQSALAGSYADTLTITINF